MYNLKLVVINAISGSLCVWGCVFVYLSKDLGIWESSEVLVIHRRDVCMCASIYLACVCVCVHSVRLGLRTFYTVASKIHFDITANL